LIASGVHAADLRTGAGADLAKAVQQLASDSLHLPDWVLPELAW